MGPDKSNINQELAQQFKALPKVVQNAITSADIQKHMRQLAETHQLHLDQWELLENEVMLTLLGLEPIESLAANIKNEVGIPAETADTLAADISKVVFEPIRQELERSLENPDAKTAAVTNVEQAGKEAVAQEKVPALAPATPPSLPPEGKAVRAPISESYKAGEPSSARTSVHDDPYRESPA